MVMTSARKSWFDLTQEELWEIGESCSTTCLSMSNVNALEPEASRGNSQEAGCDSSTETPSSDRGDVNDSGTSTCPSLGRAPSFDTDEEIVHVARTFIHFPKFDDGNDDQPLARMAVSAPATVTPITTIRVRNLPGEWRRDDFTKLLLSKGYCGCFDFVYMPMNFRSGANFGYAFVNLQSPLQASKLVEDLRCEGFDGAPASAQQGLAANIRKWRNDSVMHGIVPEYCKPVLHNAEGKRIPFPSPTGKISKPRIHGSFIWDADASA